MSDENNNGYSELYWYTGNNTPQPSWGIFSDLYVERDGMWLENGQYDEANNYVQSQWRWRMDGITEFPNRITFNQSVGYYPPDFYNKTGEKITLWDETGGDYSYAIGVEQNSMWFGVDAGGDINKGFKWYHGGSSVMDLSRAGVLNVSYITSVSMTIDQINAPDTLILQPSGVNYFINSTSISIPGSITFSDNTTQNTAFIPANYANTTYVSQLAGNAYSNAVSYVDGKSYVNSSQLSSNLSNYVTSTNLTNNLANYVTSTNLTNNLANYATSS